MRLMLIFVLSVLLIAGCSTDAGMDKCTGNTCDVAVNMSEDSNHEVNIDKLEVYHFHGDKQCSSCVTVGDYAEATVKKYFKDELEEGTIVFNHINGQKPENRELVKKYGATGSSLWLGVYNNDSFNAEQNKKVWYKVQDKQEYMQYLKGVIEKKLAGE